MGGGLLGEIGRGKYDRKGTTGRVVSPILMSSKHVMQSF